MNSSISVRPYCEDDADMWDEFCANSIQATFIHSRRFLKYHVDRFCDKSLIIELDSKWVGIFPAALDPNNSLQVVSHPGITFGGILHHGTLRGSRIVSATQVICSFYAAQGLKKILYKAIPSIYHKSPSQDDLYALFRHGAERNRCDLSSTIDLHNRLPVSERRRRNFKKSSKAGISLREGSELLPAFWKVLKSNLERKHGATPVHTLQEIIFLAEIFPNNIKCVCGVIENEVVAGVLLFTTNTVEHAQYIAANDKGHEISALDSVFEFCINKACLAGKRWFDFGISNEAGGYILNDNLYRFKSEFGGGGVVHEFFSINL